MSSANNRTFASQHHKNHELNHFIINALTHLGLWVPLSKEGTRLVSEEEKEEWNNNEDEDDDDDEADEGEINKDVPLWSSRIMSMVVVVFEGFVVAAIDFGDIIVHLAIP